MAGLVDLRIHIRWVKCFFVDASKYIIFKHFFPQLLQIYIGFFFFEVVWFASNRWHPGNCLAGSLSQCFDLASCLPCACAQAASVHTLTTIYKLQPLNIGHSDCVPTLFILFSVSLAAFQNFSCKQASISDTLCISLNKVQPAAKSDPKKIREDCEERTS